VKGSIRDPDVGIDKGVLLARGAGAVGLAVIAAPLAALLPLTNTGFGNGENHCAPLLSAMQKATPAAAKSPY
jgi:hypothetical protein